MNFNKDTMKKLMLLVAFGIFLYVGLQNTQLFISAIRYFARLLSPFLIGGCIAFILNVPMRFFEKKIFENKKVRKHKHIYKMKRVLSIVVTLIVVFGVVAIVLFLIIPELYNSLSMIGKEFTGAATTIPEWFAEMANKFPFFREELFSIRDRFVNVDWKEIGTMLMQFIENQNFLSNTFDWASSVVSGVANFIIGLVFAIYVLAQKENLGRQLRRLFYSFAPEARVDQFLRICKLTSDAFNNFLSVQCVEALILGMMFFVSMSIFQMPYALIISLLISVTALIPVFGAFIGCIVGAILIFIINPMQSLWFIVLFIVLQQIEGNLIYPRVVGSSVGLSPIWVLSAVTLGASISGVIGMIFAIPVVCVIYTLLRESVNERIKKRKISEEKIR